MDKFQNKYRIPAARSSNWDYGTNGLYFVTICTKERLHYFGEVIYNGDLQIIDKLIPRKETQNIASLQYSEIGRIAEQFWLDIPKHFPFIELDEFILMPNHIHGILFINKPNYEQWQGNKFGVQSQNLPAVIRGYKAGVKAFATKNNIEFSWQSRYFDRIVRSEMELQNIRHYIFENPEKWETNKDNHESLLM